MNVITLTSFIDEMEKIAALIRPSVVAEGAQAAKNLIREGWQAGRWMGAGKYTKYLPVGEKSLTLGSAAALAPSALRKEDPSGSGRSRLERVGALAGGTLAGIAGARAGLIPSIAVGMGGEYLGGRAGRLVSKRKAPSVAAPPPSMPPDAQT